MLFLKHLNQVIVQMLVTLLLNLRRLLELLLRKESFSLEQGLFPIFVEFAESPHLSLLPEDLLDSYNHRYHRTCVYVSLKSVDVMNYGVFEFN